MHNRRTVITFDVFDFTCRVIFARDFRKTAQHLKIGETAQAATITSPEAPGYCWLVFPTNPTPGMIAHECSHAVRAMFKYVGVPEDDETFAYHLEYLVDRVYKFLKHKKGFSQKKPPQRKGA